MIYNPIWGPCNDEFHHYKDICTNLFSVVVIIYQTTEKFYQSTLISVMTVVEFHSDAGKIQ